MSSLPKPRFLDRTTPPHVITLVLCAGISTMSINIFLPSLPAMATYFETEYQVIQLSVSLYLIATAVVQIVIGPISDRFGRRPVLIGAILGFLLMTLGTIFAPTPYIFLAFRMGQAISSAGIVLSRAAIRDMVGPAQAASMIGYVTMAMSLVPMFAPAIGGVLEVWTGWRGSFWCMFGTGALVLALVWADMGETTQTRPTSFAAQFAQYPELLSSQRFWGYALGAAFCSGSYFAYLGGAPYVAQHVFGLSPAMLGFYLGAPALGYGIGNYISGRYSVRVGLNRMILIGCIVQLAGMTLSPILYASGLTQPALFFALVTTLGLGNGMSLPNTTAGLLSVRPQLAGTASGLGGAIMIGGGALMSILAAAALGPESGPYPLQIIMLLSAAAALTAILLVIRRERVLAEQAPTPKTLAD